MSKGQTPETIGNMTFKEANLVVVKHYKRTYGFARDILDSVFGKGEATTELGSTDGGGHLTVDDGEIIDDPTPEGLEVIVLEDEDA